VARLDVAVLGAFALVAACGDLAGVSGRCARSRADAAGVGRRCLRDRKQLDLLASGNARVAG